MSAQLLAAQLYAESGFNPFARSPAGAEGIAQFMPGTAEAMGLLDPFDPADGIHAQAHLTRDLPGRFGSVPLALAAHNAGPGAVAACGCIPPYPETRAYVAKILGLLGGAGEVGLVDLRSRPANKPYSRSRGKMRRQLQRTEPPGHERQQQPRSDRAQGADDARV